MAVTIGRFQKVDDGYTGVIETITFQVKPVRFVKRDKSATFSIHGPHGGELGTAWLKNGYGVCEKYFVVKLHCPFLAAPINALMSLKANEVGLFLLRWQRRERNGEDHSK
jgi:uncharacterized protein (DUF736 family)